MSASEHQPHLGFKRVIEEYNGSSSSEFRTVELDPGVELIYLEGWPDSVHYEFYDYNRARWPSDKIGVEIHLEKEDVAFLAETLSSFDRMQILETGELAEFNYEDRKKHGRIVLKFSYNELANDELVKKIAKAMQELIRKTSEIIDQKIQEGPPETE